MGNNNKKLNLNKDELYDMYIVKEMTSKEIANYYHCCTKSVRNYLIRYDISVRTMAESVKLERSKWSKEKELARARKFSASWRNLSDDVKLNIYKVRSMYANTEDAIMKARITKSLNNSNIKSKAEELFYNKLLLIFDSNDVIRQYIDLRRYPFSCDFYIKSKDLFIEYQGHQTHGFKPYDEADDKCITHLSLMQGKGYDMKTWTVRDVKKLNAAKSNKIKLLIVYPKNDSYLVINGITSNIGKINTFNINDIK